MLSYELKKLDFRAIPVVIFLTIILYYSFYYSTKLLYSKHILKNGTISLQNSSSHYKKKILLLWTKYYGTVKPFLEIPDSEVCYACNCKITLDRSYLNVSKAILFHWYSVDMNDLPQHRKKDQLWVLYNREAPPVTPMLYTKKLGPLINLTATYRSDSDFIALYGRLRNKTGEEKAKGSFEMKSFISNKTSLVAWMVSHCKTASNRESFVNELEKVIPVDKYGRCGDLTCPYDRIGRNNGKKRLKCYRYIGRKYKFYLSFENSICKDYVTEKFFSALDAGVVPVVLGGADYEKYVPKGSYINALDFPSPEKLGEYLLNVASNESLYASYLEWKKDYIVEMDHYGSTWGCELCRRVNNVETKPNAWNDLTSWYLKGAHCQKWSTDFKKSQEK